MQQTRQFLEMALIGYQAQKAEIEGIIANLRHQLGIKPPAHGAALVRHEAALVRRTSRKMSASARRRIAQAQKKRWAAYHKNKNRIHHPKKRKS